MTRANLRLAIASTEVIGTATRPSAEEVETVEEVEGWGEWAGGAALRGLGGWGVAGGGCGGAPRPPPPPPPPGKSLFQLLLAGLGVTGSDLRPTVPCPALIPRATR